MAREQVVAAFRERYGGEPEIVAVAPGRVNLIGEHTDYNGGFVFPAAIDQELWLAASPAAQSELVSLELGAAPVFDTDTVSPGDELGWAAYPAGVAWAFREAGHRVPNLQAVVGSTVPIGAGVSSSAAIEMAFARVWDRLLGLELPSLDLARLGQRSENGFLGVQSGLMDQMASISGVAGNALLFDTLASTIEPVPLPADLQIVICDTGVSRKLAADPDVAGDSWYNERRGQCELVASMLAVPNLRMLERARLEQRKGELPEVAYRRARHVLTENERCLEFADALRRGQTERLGPLMRASHESLRDDYEVTGEALNRMAEACWASPGCVGARMTGAGFGGACVALVERSVVAAFIESADRAFGGGRFVPCEVVDGARVVE